MTIQEFSQQYKKQNPQFSNVDDLTLVNKVISSYPQFKDKLNQEEIIKITPTTESKKESTSPVKKEEGFLSNIKNSLLKRAGDVKQTVSQTKSGKLDPASSGIQTVGAIAGGVGDIIGETVGAIPGVKQLIGGIANAYGTYNKAIGGASAKEVGAVYNSFKEKHPTAAKDLESIFNIATLMPTYKGAQIAGKVSDVGGNALLKSAEKSTLKGAEEFAAKLVKPVDTKKSMLFDVTRTSETGSGIFKKSIIEPTYSEKLAGQTVKLVPGISPNKTFQQNYNIIRDYNKTLASSLEKDIANTKFIIPKKEVISKLEQAAKTLTENPLIVGDAEKMANKLIEGAKKIVNENAGNGSGLLKARKDFDIWVKSQKPNVFQANAENALTIANKEIRNAFNNLLESKSPSVGLKARLAQQHSLFSALEAIAPKAMVEANTAIGRGMQNIGKVLGTKNKAVQATAAVAGIGGLGAAATFAPAIAAIGIPSWLLYKGGKQLLKPGVRKAAGTVLKGASKILPK
jgi:hypothetical protein